MAFRTDNLPLTWERADDDSIKSQSHEVAKPASSGKVSLYTRLYQLKLHLLRESPFPMWIAWEKGTIASAKIEP